MVPLPKIAEMYAMLARFKYLFHPRLEKWLLQHSLVCGLSEKIKFVNPMGKFEFWKAPFELAQAPAYFQWLINEVLSGLDFAFRYLDDILIYSPNLEIHLKHIEIVL